MASEFSLVDVFGVANFSGNPLAVITGVDDLTTGQMQRITQWLNLSETAFLLPATDPRADYRVRIFTLTHELPFAGHPTLGSCHAWLEAGGVPRDARTIVQQCGAGLVRLRRGDGRLAFAAPPLLRSGPVDEAELAEIASVLRIERDAIVEAQWVDNGPGWVGVLLRSAAEVLAVEPARKLMRRMDIGLVGAHPPGAEAAFELRGLFTAEDLTLIEDPVTGSLNASMAQWLFASGRATGSYVAAQGTRLSRTGRIYLQHDGAGDVWTGGQTRTLFRGHRLFANDRG